jgi:hypothetical protein
MPGEAAAACLDARGYSVQHEVAEPATTETFAERREVNTKPASSKLLVEPAAIALAGRNRRNT